MIIFNSQNVEATNIITVCSDGPSVYNYSKIMYAISNANKNDTINIYGGTYLNKKVKEIPGFEVFLIFIATLFFSNQKKSIKSLDIRISPDY
jgi:hypothetical protein